MKNRIIIDANKVYLDSSHNLEVYSYLKTNYFGSNSYYDILRSQGGVYLIKNKLTNKYYVGSTKNYFRRHFILFESSSYRSTIARRKCHKFINESNLDEFEIIFLLNTLDNFRIKEERYISILNATNPKFGYNICKKSIGGCGHPGKRWVTNCDTYDLLINYDDPTPKGFYPGQKKVSFVKNFLNDYPEYINRTKDSELIELTLNDRRELLKYCNTTTFKNGGRHIYSLMKNLKEHYNIVILFR